MKINDIYKVQDAVRDVMRKEGTTNGLGMIAKQLGIEEIIFQLPERERGTMLIRFGLDGNGTRTLEEVGRERGVTRERIRQLEKSAFTKIMKSLEGGFSKKYWNDMYGKYGVDRRIK